MCTIGLRSMTNPNSSTNFRRLADDRASGVTVFVNCTGALSVAYAPSPFSARPPR
jgi:hypothetical protein